MNSIKRTIRWFLPVLFSVIVLATGCAEAKRSKIVAKTRMDSCDLTQMGKNRYYHSNHYKRNLSGSIRKISRR